MKHSEAKLGPRLVLLALAEFADDDGTNSCPSVDTLTHRTRMSRRAVQTALRRLEADSMIEQTGTTEYGTMAYRIIGLGGAQDLRGGAQKTPNTGRKLRPTKSPSSVVEPNGSPTSEAGAKKRPRNPVFDAVATGCGKNLASLTRTASKEVGVAAAEIAAALRREGVPEEAWAEEVNRRARAYRRQYPTWTLTPSALKKWWPELGPKVRSEGPAACPDCGTGGGMHLADCPRTAAA